MHSSVKCEFARGFVGQVHVNRVVKVLKIFLHKMAARGQGVACLLLGLLAGCLAEEPAAEDKFAGVLAAEPEGKVPPPAPASRLQTRRAACGRGPAAGPRPPASRAASAGRRPQASRAAPCGAAALRSEPPGL